jgi:RNA polymerase sigma factor (sigma-70 family)
MSMHIHILRDLEEPADDAPGAVQHGVALQGALVANYEYLRRRLVRHLGCPDMASECLHDVWVRLGELDIRDDVLHPLAYVYRMACNVAVDRMRSNRSWQYAGDADVALESLVDRAPGPELIAEARSDVAAVDRAMERLPGRHRGVLIALRINEMTRQEAAIRFDLSLRGVDTALRQALDYCAAHAGQQVLAGVSAPRRAVRPLQVS